MFYLFAAYSEKKTALSKKNQVKKVDFAYKMDVLSILLFSPSPFLYYDLSFDMQKLSYVTNIH